MKFLTCLAFVICLALAYGVSPMKFNFDFELQIWTNISKSRKLSNSSQLRVWDEFKLRFWVEFQNFWIWSSSWNFLITKRRYDTENSAIIPSRHTSTCDCSWCDRSDRRYWSCQWPDHCSTENHPGVERKEKTLFIRRTSEYSKSDLIYFVKYLNFRSCSKKSWMELWLLWLESFKPWANCWELQKIPGSPKFSPISSATW